MVLIDIITDSWLVGTVPPVLVIFFIFLGVHITLKRGKLGTLHDIYRDKGVYPSLSRFQALLWTLVFAFTILSAFMVAGYRTPTPSEQVPPPSGQTLCDQAPSPSEQVPPPSGQTLCDQAPSSEQASPSSEQASPSSEQASPSSEQASFLSVNSITLIIGAMAGVVIGQGLSETKYSEYYQNSIKKGENFSNLSIPMEKPRRFITMLMEKDKIEITRVQLFVWTWIAILIYLATFFIDMNSSIATGTSVTLPPIDPSLLTLSGLSQAGYVAGKAVMKTATGDDAAEPAKQELLTK